MMKGSKTANIIEYNLTFPDGLTIAISPPETKRGIERINENSNPVVFVRGRNCSKIDRIIGIEIDNEI